MTKDQLVRLLRDPSQIDEQDFVGLEKLHAEFPYAYPLSLLKLLHLKAQDSYMYQSALSQTALLSPDREKLWQWVEGEDSGVSIESPTETSSASENQSLPEPQIESTPEPQIEKTPEPIPEPVAEPVSDPVSETVREEVEVEEEVVEKTDFDTEIETPAADPPAIKPAKPLDDAPPKKLGDDLSHLPDKVRAVIERSRSIHRKINESEAAESEEPLETPIETTDSGLEEVEVAPLETPPSNAADEVGLEILEEEAEFLSFTPQESVQSEEETESTTEEVEQDEWEDTPSVEDETQEVQPVEITDSEGKHSFSVWLQMTKGEETEDEVEETPLSEGDVEGAEGEAGEKGEAELEGSTEDDMETQGDVPVKEAPKTLDEKMELIDQFIRKPPRFKPNKKNQNTLDMSKISEKSDSSIITETLAQVYRQQKHYDKAIEAYEILRLKYPEKSGLFADRILEIKKLKENK